MAPRLIMELVGISSCRDGRRRLSIRGYEASQRRSGPGEEFHPLLLATESPCRLRNIRVSACSACRASASMDPSYVNDFLQDSGADPGLQCILGDKVYLETEQSFNVFFKGQKLT